MGGNDAAHYISSYFTVEALRNTWTPKLHSFNIGVKYKEIEGPTWVPYPLARRTEPGRPRADRLPGDMDASQTGDNLRKCKICKQTGHDRRNCPSREEEFRDSCNFVHYCTTNNIMFPML